MKANRIAKARTFMLLSRIFEKFEICWKEFPDTWLFIAWIVAICLSKTTFNVSIGRKTYHTTNDNVMPRKRNTRKTIALLCSLKSGISLLIARSFPSSNFIVLYTIGKDAITVRKTMMRLVCSINIHNERSIATEE